MNFPLGKTFIVLTAITAIVFMLYPQLDIIVSALFYRDGAFFLRDNTVVRFFYLYGDKPVLIAALGVLLLFMATWLIGRSYLLGQSRRTWLYLLLAAVLGPGLVVNVILKDHYGRARPIQVEEFGGDRRFTSISQVSDQCDRNCSFTCGHCAAGFYFISVGFLLMGNHRRLAFVGGIAYGSVLGVVRLVQGGHFLSDILFSLIIVYAVSALLHYFMFRGKYIDASADTAE